MLFVIGSVVTVLTSYLIYSRPNCWNSLFSTLILELKYVIVGGKSIFVDVLNYKYNKIELANKCECVAVVTGGSRGIGLSIVKMLLQCNMEVIIACRNINSGEKAIEHIRQAGVTEGRAKVYMLDNASLKSVRQFVELIKQDFQKINILVNNAGVMFTPYAKTEDGFEMQWAVNYLSHFLLTGLLLPLLCNGGTSNNYSRIVNVSSCAHVLGTINFNDINYKKLKPFVTKAAYAQSKLAQIIFTKSLQRMCDEKNVFIKAYATNPGLVNTDLFHNSFMNNLSWLKTLLFKTPEQGATTSVYAAINDSIKQYGGQYLSNCHEDSIHPIANDVSVQDKLFKLSLQHVKLENFL